MYLLCTVNLRIIARTFQYVNRNLKFIVARLINIIRYKDADRIVNKIYYASIQHIILGVW